MPEIARKDGTDTVTTNHGCDATTVTNFVNGKGIGRKNDEYSGHTVSSGSSNVFAGG